MASPFFFKIPVCVLNNLYQFYYCTVHENPSYGYSRTMWSAKNRAGYPLSPCTRMTYTFQATMPSLKFYSNINSPLCFDKTPGKVNRTKAYWQRGVRTQLLEYIERLTTDWPVDGGLQKNEMGKIFSNFCFLCKPRTYILEEVEEGPAVAVMPSLAAPSACGHCEVNWEL